MTKRELKRSWSGVSRYTEDTVDNFLIDIFVTYSQNNLEVPIYTLAKELQEALFLPFVDRLNFVKGVLEC